MDFLIVVDMQNDFVDGALGTKEAEAMSLPTVAETIRGWDRSSAPGTRTRNFTFIPRKGSILPVIHCVEGTEGWELNPVIAEAADVPDTVMELNKPSLRFPGTAKMHSAPGERWDPISSITLVGLCTDICVISNAMILKAAFPETPIRVLETLCQRRPERRRNALNAMKVCQIEVESSEPSGEYEKRKAAISKSKSLLPFILGIN